MRKNEEALSALLAKFKGGGGGGGGGGGHTLSGTNSEFVPERVIDERSRCGISSLTKDCLVKQRLEEEETLVAAQRS